MEVSITCGEATHRVTKPCMLRWHWVAFGLLCELCKLLFLHVPCFGYPVTREISHGATLAKWWLSQSQLAILLNYHEVIQSAVDIISQREG